MKRLALYCSRTGLKLSPIAAIDRKFSVWAVCSLTLGVIGLSQWFSVAVVYCQDVALPMAAVNESDLKNQVLRLTRELDANQRTRRLNAERELLDLGPAILNVLPSPELIPNPAVRASVSKIRKVLELRKASESVQASLITTAKDIPLGEFLEQVEAQTTNQIDASRLSADQKKVAITQSFADVSFWPAVETAFQQAKVHGEFRPDAPALRISVDDPSRRTRDLAVTNSGAFRVALESLKVRDVAGSDQKRLRAGFAVTPEPRLRALFLKFSARDFTAITAGGEKLLAADLAAQLDLPLGEGGRHVVWNLDFLVPTNTPVNDLKNPSIRGQTTMQVAAGTEYIRILNLAKAKGVSRRRGGVTVSVLDVKSRKATESKPDVAELKKDVSVQIQVAYDSGGPAFESHRTWIFHNQVFLTSDSETIDSDVRWAPTGGYETEMQGNGVIRVTYRFNSVSTPLEQLQFVYAAPTLIVDVPIQFELTPGQFLWGK